MSKKRGLSLEEKRQKMLEIFYEKKMFFQLKELEKIAPKEKGITPMSVKEVLQSLVDDNLVDAERIGTSNYFWSYPSKAMHMRKRKQDQLTNDIHEVKKIMSNSDELLQQAKKGKENSDERNEVLLKLTKLKEENKSLKVELQRYQDCDPEVIKEVQIKSNEALDSANRWTDNLFAIKSWCNKKFNIDSKTLDKQFGIPEDFDYIE